MNEKMIALEKEKNTEKALRSRLEEEYMQITRSHEEEVTLRLQFEAKLNELHQMYRKLEIEHEREQQKNIVLT